MTAINGFIYRTRAGTKIISPIGLELESPAVINLTIPDTWGITAEVIRFCRQQIIRTCWNLRGIRQGYMASQKDRLKKMFADEAAKEWGKRFTRPQSQSSFHPGVTVNPVRLTLLVFLGSNKRQKSDIQRWMAGFELHIARLVLAMEGYCLSRSTAGGMNPDPEMLENLSWTDDWLTKIQKQASQQYSFGEHHLVHADVEGMLFSVVQDAADTAFNEFLLILSCWEKMPGFRKALDALINKAVVLKIHLDELERIGHPGVSYYAKQVDRLLRRTDQTRTLFKPA